MKAPIKAPIGVQIEAPIDPSAGHDADRPAGHVARRLLWTATLLLPRGVSRNRYRREFAAELYGQSRRRQLAYAVSVSGHMWSLRAVLVHGDAAVHVPLLCRTNLHHHWVTHRSEAGVRFQTCARCDKEKDGLTGDPNFLAMGVAATNH